MVAQHCTRLGSLALKQKNFGLAYLTRTRRGNSTLVVPFRRFAVVSVASLQACVSLPGYRRLWRSGFRRFGPPGSLVPLVKLLKVVSFCFFSPLVVVPPSPFFVVLGGRLSPAWALPIRA